MSYKGSVFMFSKLLSLIAGLIFVSSIAFAGYAVTYSTNAFGYSDASSYVTVDLTTHVDHYTDYPNYNYTYNYYPNYNPNYSAYYYSGSYYYYPRPANYYYVAPVYPVYAYTTYTVAPVYAYNYYPNGWYYN